MKLLVGGIGHETHTFSKVKTTLEHFQEQELLYNDELISYFKNTRTEIGGMIDGAKAQNVDLIPTLYGWATPSGLVCEDALDHLMSNLITRITKIKADGILLCLHGAMVAENNDDVEGYLLEEIRSKIGSRTPIIATLDLHANISELMVQKADVLIGYDTYPHTDPYERGVEAVEVITKIVREKLSPVTALEEPPLLPAVQRMLTNESPMKELIDLAHQMESEDDVIVVTVSGGFPYSDVPFAGISLVVSCNKNRELARDRAKELCELAWSKRQEFTVCNLSVDESVRKAISTRNAPVILVDIADNIGGGSPGDGTALLESLIDQGAKDALIVINDPEAVQASIEAGINEKVEMKVGGKIDNLHGDPILIEGKVKLISNGEFGYKGSYMTGRAVNMGPTVVLECQGTTLVLTTFKTMPFDLQQLRSLGIEPKDLKIIVVKSAIAWRAAYESIAEEIIEVDTPGLCSPNLRHFDYKKIRRPIFPLDDI